MNRGGIGSASIVLVFAVLCLTIFTVISFVPALTEQRLAELEVQAVQDFFAADVHAEQVLAAILAAEIPPEYVGDIAIDAYWDWDLFAEVISFAVPASEETVLYVVAVLWSDDYTVQTWRILNLAEWEADQRLPVFQGWDDDFMSGW